MTTYLSEDENQIIEENTAYVLGMYDLYPNDHDIISALQTKGVQGSLIPHIMNRVKIPAYQKRVKQAKRNILAGSILSLLGIGIYVFLKSLPQAETILSDNDGDVAILILMVKFYREIFYFGFFIAIMQIISDCVAYKKYTHLLQEHFTSAGSIR
jgi:hypothetical protein